MTGTAADFTVEKSYIFGERMGRVEFTGLLMGSAIKRDAYRMVRQRIEAPPTAFRKRAERSIKISVVALDTLKSISIYPAVSGGQAIGIPVYVLKYNMSFSIDLMAGGTKHRTFAGSPEEVAATVSILIGKWMKIMTSYTAQLAVCKGQITGY